MSQFKINPDGINFIASVPFQFSMTDVLDFISEQLMEEFDANRTEFLINVRESIQDFLNEEIVFTENHKRNLFRVIDNMTAQILENSDSWYTVISSNVDELN